MKVIDLKINFPDAVSEDQRDALQNWLQDVAIQAILCGAMVSVKVDGEEQIFPADPDSLVPRTIQ